MKRLVTLGLIGLLGLASQAAAASLTGRYVEARTCDVWTGPCIANAEFNLTGKNAVIAWQVDKGTFAGVRLDGLGIVAVVEASDTIGLKQTGPAKAILLVDKRATPEQRRALIQMAQKQAGKLLSNVIAVRESEINVELHACPGNACAEVVADQTRLRTRCLYAEHDKVCGNETAYFPPLSNAAKHVRAAVAEENSYRGTGLGHTWSDFGQRSAYVGHFEIP